MITERQYAPDYFQHCSTISSGPPGSGTFVAYYTGKAECHQSQHVEIHWFDENGTEARPVALEELTGNPILVETLEGTRLIYSKFENTPVIRGKWWQYCSLWAITLDIKWDYNLGISLPNPKIIIGDPKQIIVDEPNDNAYETEPPEGLGYLARCHPIWVSDGYLLPLYCEHSPNFHGTILWSKDGLNWEYRGSIGKEEQACIQPTIWYDKENKKLRALLRNFSRSRVKTDPPMAFYSESEDNGYTWSSLKSSNYYNANNSLVVLNVRDTPLVVWNNDPAGRNDISLGGFNLDRPLRIAKLDGYGSYPSISHDNKKLKIAYTTHANPLKAPKARTVIKVKEYDLETVVQTCRKNMT